MSMRLLELCFSQDELQKIFSFETKLSDRLTSRENGRLEFKESFNLANIDAYAKTATAFANAQGGYIVFGVKDKPRQLLGLKSDHFATFDAAKLANALNERFSPEIHWEAHACEIRGYKVGILYFAEAKQKPVICTRNGSGLQTGAIFYRYRGRSEAIRYPELRRIIEEEKARERELWMRQLRRMSEVGVDHIGLLDLHSGEVTG
jgi:predicted HTH transcriptional regulator